MSKGHILRRMLKWGLGGLLVVAVLFSLQVTLLACPQILVSDHVEAGSVQLYHDGARTAELERLAADVDQRLRTSGYVNSENTHRVYFFRSPKTYTLFARLAMVTPLAQGFGLSIFGNSYVSEQRVNLLGERTGGYPKYGIWEGDPAHTIAHEIGHNVITDQIGRGVWRRLPHWKQEGLPEYIANIGRIRDDSLATLAHRFTVLQDDWNWGGGDRWDRIHYEAGLLVEYLIDVEGLTVEDIVSDRISRESTRAALSEWCRSM